jgi:hypothetical protein
MKQSSLTPQCVSFIPEKLNEGVLYICEQYRTASHKCCCGCGEEVVTPLTPADWSIRKEGGTVTLHPSIGNWGFACRSHYWIRKNQVIWAKPMSQKEINHIRARDSADKEAYIAIVNRRKEQQPASPDIAKPIDVRKSLPHQLWLAIVRWLKG